MTITIRVSFFFFGIFLRANVGTLQNTAWSIHFPSSPFHIQPTTERCMTNAIETTTVRGT